MLKAVLFINDMFSKIVYLHSMFTKFLQMASHLVLTCMFCEESIVWFTFISLGQHHITMLASEDKGWYVSVPASYCMTYFADHLCILWYAFGHFQLGSYHSYRRGRGCKSQNPEQD